MWYTLPRFSLIFTSSSVYGLIYTRRHLLATQRFDPEIMLESKPVLDWLMERGSPGMAGVLCIPQDACQSGRMTLPGNRDRYACYLQVQTQVAQETWFDYHIYYDMPGKQTRIYWYALNKATYNPLVTQLEEKGFAIRGISTAPLLLRYAVGSSIDKQGVTYIYHDDHALHFCVYQNRTIVSTLSHSCEKIDANALQTGFQNLQQQIPLTSYAHPIACTPQVQALCQELALKTSMLNTAWDGEITKALPEYVRLAGGLIAREWYEFTA